MSYPVILVKQPDKKPLYVQLHESIDIGRDCDGLVLADGLVSRRHASLELIGDDVAVTDLNSTNGTFVNGVRIDTTVVLTPGAEIRLGDTTLELLSSSDARRTIGVRGTATLVAAAGALVPAALPAEIGDASSEPVTRSNENVDRGVRPDSEDRGTITIVFSDIVSSTEHATALGDVAWMDVLAAHNEIVRAKVHDWNGSVVKAQGDGFLLTFPSVRRGLRCMSEVQRAVRELSEQHDGLALQIRVGVHIGEVIVSGGDIFGRHVVIASRISSVADGDEILVSRLAHEIASSRGDLRFGPPRDVTLKGIGDAVSVYPLLWDN